MYEKSFVQDHILKKIELIERLVVLRVELHMELIIELIL